VAYSPGTAPTTIAPIAPIQTISGNQAKMMRIAEAATRTFKQGAVVVVTIGYVNESAAIQLDTTQIAGFATEAAHNQTAAGTPGPGLTYGSVPNQASAKIIAVGSPPEDGCCGVDVACEDTLFVGYTNTEAVLAVTDRGAKAGLTKDGTSGFWFVDRNQTVAFGLVVEIVELLDAVGTSGGRVIFKVNKANQQLAV